MKFKTLITTIVLMAYASTLFAQEFAVDKGETFLVRLVSFSSQGGELFEDYDGNNATTFNLAPQASVVL